MNVPYFILNVHFFCLRFRFTLFTLHNMELTVETTTETAVEPGVGFIVDIDVEPNVGFTAELTVETAVEDPENVVADTYVKLPPQIRGYGDLITIYRRLQNLPRVLNHVECFEGGDVKGKVVGVIRDCANDPESKFHPLKVVAYDEATFIEIINEVIQTLLDHNELQRSNSNICCTNLKGPDGKRCADLTCHATNIVKLTPMGCEMDATLKAEGKGGLCHFFGIHKAFPRATARDKVLSLCIHGDRCRNAHIDVTGFYRIDSLPAVRFGGEAAELTTEVERVPPPYVVTGPPSCFYPLVQSYGCKKMGCKREHDLRELLHRQKFSDKEQCKFKEFLANGTRKELVFDETTYEVIHDPNEDEDLDMSGAGCQPRFHPIKRVANTSEGTSEGTGKEAGKRTGKEAGKGAGKEADKEAGKGAGKEAGKGGSKGAGKGAGKKGGKGGDKGHREGTGLAEEKVDATNEDVGPVDAKLGEGGNFGMVSQDWESGPGL